MFEFFFGFFGLCFFEMFLGWLFVVVGWLVGGGVFFFFCSLDDEVGQELLGSKRRGGLEGGVTVCLFWTSLLFMILVLDSP